MPVMDGKAGSKQKPLRVSTNLVALNKLIEPIDYAKSGLKCLANTLDRLYDMAYIEYRNGEEETAYLYFMRFISSYQYLRKHKFEVINGYNARIKDALEKSTNLSDSLDSRYKAAEPHQVKKHIEQFENLKFKDNEDLTIKGKKDDMSGINGIYQSVKKDENQLTVEELKCLMDMRSTRFLLIDCRDTGDFDRSHPNHSDCICISGVILVKGKSANQLNDDILRVNPNSYDLWIKRASFDLIVLYDWNSSFQPRNANPIFVLFDAMTQWDPNTKYKGAIKILQGGMREFFRKYPSYLTNAAFGVADVLDKETSRDFQPVSLDSISYPSMDESPALTPERNNNPAASKSQNAFQYVDRSTKPPQSKPTGVPLVNGITTDVFIPEKGKEIVAALDALIDQSRKVVKSEDDMRTLQQDRKANRITSDLEIKLKAKEEELEAVNAQLCQKSLAYDQLKLNYDQHVTKEKERRILPSVQPSPMEVSIAAKEAERKKLNEFVQVLRVERKQREKDLATQFAVAPTVNGFHDGVQHQTLSSTDVAQRPTAPKPILPSIRPSFEDRVGTKFTEKLKPEEQQQRNSSLKRSRSNPGLASMSFEDNETPLYSRHLKPLGRREYATVSSTQRSGRTGLKNLGNTCFMNSIVQCLAHTGLLVDYILENRNCQPKGKTRGQITKELALTFQELQQGHRSISLEALKRLIYNHYNYFASGQQQDSHELLTVMLAWMHEELNRVEQKKQMEQKNDGVPDDIAAGAAWEDYSNSNDSIITRLFCGEQKSTVRCLTCQKASVTFDTFFILSVPIPPGPESSNTNLNACLDLYTSAEVVEGWKCPHCNRKGKAEKKIDLWRLPHYLIIHLKRFYNNDGTLRKRLRGVESALENLDLSSRLKGNGRQRSIFDLYAVSNHYGSMDGGHYTAFCRDQESWIKFDDPDVGNISPREVSATAAYILFYRNKEELL